MYKRQVLNDRDFRTAYGRDTTGIDGFCRPAQFGNEYKPEVVLRGNYYKTDNTMLENVRQQSKDVIDKRYGKTHAEGVREAMVERMVEKYVADEAVMPHFSAPLEERLTLHTTVHEFGHATDNYLRYPEAKQMQRDLFDKWKSELPSRYAQALPQEAYAECFAQWTLTRGETTNPAVRAYADAYGWRKP